MGARVSSLSCRSAVVRGLLTFVCASAACIAASSPASAAEPLRVTIDPGHGGPEIGASHIFPDGTVLQEKSLTLRVALRLRDLLTQAGYAVTLTRTTDSPVNADGVDLTGDGQVNLADDLQARIDMANRAGSDLFVSVHFNGNADPTLRGTYTFWNPDRPYSERSKALAEQVQAALVRSLKAAGYATLDHGARTDRSILGGDAYYLLSPRSSIVSRPSTMPAIIAEPLFLTNTQDATALLSDRVVEAVARGYFDGIRAYVGQSPPASRPAASQPGVAAVPRPLPSHSQDAPSQQAPVARGASPTAGPYWTAWAVTYQDTPKGQRLSAEAVRDLTARGLPAAVIASSSYASLLPGFLIVSSGHFPTRSTAAPEVALLRAAGYADAYLREVVPN